MKTVPHITDAEWEVMKVLWNQSPRTANEVIDAMQDQTEWKPKTIRTLLNRLTQKQALSFTQENRVYAYFPLVSEGECVKSETQSFLKECMAVPLSRCWLTFEGGTALGGRYKRTKKYSRK